MPSERVVEVEELETTDTALSGVVTVTSRLPMRMAAPIWPPAHEGAPPGLSFIHGSSRKLEAAGGTHDGTPPPRMWAKEFGGRR